jgi:hypothetical protein
MENKISKIKRKCEICEEEGNIICFDCIKYYCDSCSNFIHSKKINQNHSKEKINFFQLYIKCEIHPKKNSNFFF